MGGYSPVHSDHDPSRDCYLEFSFFDGVMVECGDIDFSEGRPLESKENNHKIKCNAASITEQNHLQVGELHGNKSANVGLDSLKGDRPDVRGSCAMCFSPSTLQDPEGETCVCAPLHPSLGGCNHSEVLSKQRSLWKDRNSHKSFTGNSFVRSGSVVSTFHGENLGTKDLSFKKRVQFCSEKNVLCSGQQAESENRTWNKISGPILKNCGASNRASSLSRISQQVKDLQCDSWQASAAEISRAEFVGGHPWSSQTVCADCVSSENFNRREYSLTGDCGQGQIHVPDTLSCSQRGKIPTLSDRVNSSYRKSWKDIENVQGTPDLAAWGVSVGPGSPRCSSASMTDLAESVVSKRSPRSILQSESICTLPSHLEPTGAGLLQSNFHNDHLEAADIESGVPLGHFDSVQPVSKTALNPLSVVGISTGKKEFKSSKSEVKKLSITDPAPCRTKHGLLHSTLRHGLPNYTFLLDDYEEVVTAKIWMDDMVIGKEQGTWCYTFYSLRGEGKKKGKTGWKHWKRKEKLASVLVGKMKVSSILCSDSCQDGEGNMSVVSEFVLCSAGSQEPAIIVQTDTSPTTSLQSLKMASPARSEGKFANRTSSGASFQCPASFSNGGACSPEGISAWYVQQSLLPSSLAAPPIVVEGRKNSRKWSLQSGFSGMQISKTRRKCLESSSVTSSSIESKDSSMDLTWSPNQIHSELCAMIISVPLEMQDRQALAELPSRTLDGAHQEHGFTDLQRPCNHVDHNNQEHCREADITVILPSGNHSRPLSDSKGPSPLIRRWKDGGRCDCKGWDLGCGLVVLRNQRQKLCITALGNANEVANYKGKQPQAQHLALFKQDTEQEEPSLSLAPQKNGLIGLDFRAPLSPLQAFAIAVAILHGREPGVPDTNTHQVVSTVGHLKDKVQHGAFLDQISSLANENVNVPSVLVVEEEGSSACTQLSTNQSQERSKLQDSSCNAHKKIQGRDAFNHASELALSFERV